MRDEVLKAARRRGLYLLREIARTDPCSINNLLSLDAEKAIATLDQPEVRLKAGIAFLKLIEMGSLSQELTNEFVNFMKVVLTRSAYFNNAMPNARYGINETLFLGHSTVLKEIFGDRDSTLMASRPEDVEDAYSAGIEALSIVWPEEAAAIQSSTDLIAGINGNRGEIRSFSNIHLPGFMAMAINNPPALISEQLVHESSHVRLALLLENKGHFSDTIAQMPACYSPFTESIRTAERLLHGVVSYSRVLTWWKNLSEFNDLQPGWLDCKNQNEANDIINKRIDTLSKRTRLGWMSLLRGARANEISILTEIFEFMVGREPPSFEVTGDVASAAALLEPIPKAELLLAFYGVKSSRISCRVNASDIFEALLNSGVSFVVSNKAFTQSIDQGMHGFSNRFSSSSSILKSTSEHDVLCYLASTVNAARVTAERDASDVAGELFNIPVCCQSFFSNNWQAINLTTGDLFGLLLSREPEPVNLIKIPWQCNSAAMYFGGGLCWHFPCSMHCESTIEIVNQRLAHLERIDPELAEQLCSIQKTMFQWSSKNGYEIANSNNYAQVIVPC